MRYNNYHKHSYYSNIATPDSITSPLEYIKRAKDLGHTTYFTTEHGWGGNVFEAYRLCKEWNVKPIFGAEVYLTKNNSEKKDRGFHLVLIAMNNEGRKEMNSIISQANTEGYYYHARVDMKHLLTLNPENVVVTTACISSPLFKGDTWKEDFYIPIRDHFKNHFFLEVQCSNSEVQRVYNRKILKLHEEDGIPLIHANDSHYIQDPTGRSVYLKAKEMDYGDEDTLILDYPDSQTIIKRYQEQGVLTFQQAEEAIQNTLIFDQAEPIELDDDIKLPSLWEENPTGHLKRILLEEFKNKIVSQNFDSKKLKEYKQALNDEFNTIKECHMEDYFLLNYYIVKRAKELGGVLTRTGRGSAVSYLINYLLGFTEVDRLKAPIKLYPSRFMSAERILLARSLPDIDQNWYRVEEVMQASREYLGEDNVYWMVSYKPFQEASAFRAYCKGKGLNINDYDAVAKDLDSYRETREWHDLIEESKQFIGVVDAVAPSPCSVLLLDQPISREIGLLKIKDTICCCIDGYNSDVFKYVKNDYLRVQVWGLISETYKRLGQPIDDIGTLVNKSDEEVWNLLGSGDTTTINQCDSDYDKQLLSKYKPKNLAELSIYVASIRPGFKSMLQNFIQRKPYSTGNEQLDNLLSDSFHYMAYQENIMTYLHWLGIPEKETYDIIKKISKKKFKEKELEELENRLLKGWLERTGSEQGFQKTWQVVQDASRYSFNACLSGDTIIDRGTKGRHSFVPTVENLYKIKNDINYAKEHNHLSLRRKFLRNGYGTALSMMENGVLKPNEIIDIRPSGQRKIYRVITEDGRHIDCTSNHKFPTPNGKKLLADLSVGDELYVKGCYTPKPFERRFFNKGESNVPKKGEQGFQKRENGGSVLFQAAHQRHVDNQDECSLCCKPYSLDGHFELHHIDHNRKNNDDSNLMWLCNSCHKRIHYQEGRSKRYTDGIPVSTSKIKSIEFLREDETYDVEMKAPYHNLVVNDGIVTSNSHALSVAIDALYGAYLKAKHPLEYFTVALSMYAGDETRTGNLIKELDHFNITLKPPRFGHSRATYEFEREDRSITKGIESIKYLNAVFAEELYQLKDNSYSCFQDFLNDAKQKTSMNKTKMEALIKINFFEEFGNINYLLKIKDVFDWQYKKKQLSRKTFASTEAKLGLPNCFFEFYLSKYHEDLSSVKIIKGEAFEWLKQKIYEYFSFLTTTYEQMLEYEVEVLGYCQTTIPLFNKNKYLVTDVVGNKKLRVSLYEPFTGKTREVVGWKSALIRDGKVIEKGDWILIKSLAKKAKQVPTDKINPKTGKPFWKADPSAGYELEMKEWSICPH